MSEHHGDIPTQPAGTEIDAKTKPQTENIHDYPNEPEKKELRDRFNVLKEKIQKISKADYNLHIELIAFVINLGKNYTDKELRDKWLWYLAIGGTYEASVSGVNYTIYISPFRA